MQYNQKNEKVRRKINGLHSNENTEKMKIVHKCKNNK